MSAAHTAAPSGYGNTTRVTPREWQMVNALIEWRNRRGVA